MKKELTLNIKDGSDITRELENAITTLKGTFSIIKIPAGNYIISKTITLHSETILRGSQYFSTKITLANKTNNNMFTNQDYQMGNHNICIKDLWLDGNSSNQFKPDSEKRLSFCNIFYFKNGQHIQLLNIKTTNCKQTALHFNNCSDITITKLKSYRMGWSGISTSGTNNIQASEVHIYDSGKDTRHSAVHFDGGTGSYFDGIIEKCTGNGIMLDSKYSTLSKSVIKARCIDCKRGIAIFGTKDSLINDVLIQYTSVIDTEVGILVSNARHIYLTNCIINNSSQNGVLLQGKKGSSRVIINKTIFNKNKNDVKEEKNNHSNYFINNKD